MEELASVQEEGDLETVGRCGQYQRQKTQTAGDQFEHPLALNFIGDKEHHQAYTELSAGREEDAGCNHHLRQHRGRAV